MTIMYTCAHGTRRYDWNTEHWKEAHHRTVDRNITNTRWGEDRLIFRIHY